MVKIPRLPFDKFITAKRTLTTQMKATGEVMSICDNFEGALMKAIRSLEQHVDSLLSYDFSGLSREELTEKLKVADDRRIWVIAEAIRKGISCGEIHDLTMIDVWFIDKIAILVEMEEALKTKELTPDLLREAKRLEFPDTCIARLTGRTEEEVKQLRHENSIRAVYRMVDTCAAEFAASTPYYYSVYGGECESSADRNSNLCTAARKKVLVLGSGPIRIGQGIEFDYCSVHATWAFSREGYETIIINNNPETVSTDFDIADKLYFEPLTPEDVETIVNMEKPDGAVVQFGGQTAIKLTESLMKMGVPIWGQRRRMWMPRRTGSFLTKYWRRRRFPGRQAERCTLRRRPRRWQTGWDTLCWYDLPMCWADRACRLPFPIRKLRNLWKSSTGLPRIIPFWWINIFRARRLRWMRCATARIF